MRKLKIGFDAKRLFHNKSGLGNYARTLVVNLRKYYPQHEYHLFVASLPQDTDFVKEFLAGDFIIHTNKSFAPNGWWRTVGCASAINDLSLDIYHGLSHELPFGISSSTKKIVTFHDIIYAKMPQLFTKVDALLYNLKYSNACNRADGIIAISKSTAKDLDELYRVSSKTQVIYQACDPIFYYNKLEDTNRDYYLYVGTINARKNLSSIVKAYSLLPKELQLPFHVIGEGGKYKAEVQQELTSLSLNDNFIFHGHVDNEILIQFYRGAKALVYPSYYEGFGIPIIEALYNGCPVITSGTSSLPEAAGPGGILVDPNDITSMRNAMVEINKEERAITLRMGGHTYVNSNFDPAKLSEQLIDYYHFIKSKLV